jgi:ATP-dependent DNA ligase
MSGELIMKAVEWDKLPSAFKKKYPTLEALQADGWWLQKKYDGCFAMATVRQNGDSGIYTREGNVIRSCQHVLDDLSAALDDEYEFDWPHEAYTFLGELWTPDLPFKKISGLVRRHDPALDLGLWCNDMIVGAKLASKLPYHERFDMLRAVFPGGTQFVDVAETWKSFEWKASTAMQRAKQWRAEGGYDGAIMRAPNEPYVIGLVKKGEIIKVKPVMSLDLRIKRVTVEQQPTKLGGFITVDMGNDVECDVGSGLTQADLESFKHELAIGAWVNKIAECECLDLTEDGKMREPRFKGLRMDKTEADK